MGGQGPVCGARVEGTAPSMGDTWGMKACTPSSPPRVLRKERSSVGMCEEPERVRGNHPPAFKKAGRPSLPGPWPHLPGPVTPLLKAAHYHPGPAGRREHSRLETLLISVPAGCLRSLRSLRNMTCEQHVLGPPAVLPGVMMYSPDTTLFKGR